MENHISNADLLAYLDEMLTEERSAEVEQLLRETPQLQERLLELTRNRDTGQRSIGEVWRRHGLSCPSRSELTSYVLSILEPARADYIAFHLDQVGCRVCQANLDDLKSLQQTLTESPESETRRSRYFESSAGLLRSQRDDE
ncbi:MAG: hypothetical protein R3C18_16585 [Planctomycetaceae bacterium]